MNYRHAFHAGNFADLVKHVALLALLDALKAEPGPFEVIDTHAGAGLYDLDAGAARRSGEAQAGVARLMQAHDPPEALVRLAAEVRALNGGGPLRRYPGSPLLAARTLRPGDRYTGFELHAEDAEELRRVLAVRTPPGITATAIRADGYEAAAVRLGAGGRKVLMVDPPFERADDYARVAELIANRPGPRRPPALIWTPLKDLETFDAFLGRLEAGACGSVVSVECRMRPLDDPMRLNGCAVVLVDAPDIGDAMLDAARWTAGTLGESGASARRLRLGMGAT